MANQFFRAIPSATPGAVLATLATLAMSACAVGPDYKRPAIDTGVAFKEAEGWKLANPSDALDRGDWWTVFNDPELNRPGTAGRGLQPESY